MASATSALHGRLLLVVVIVVDSEGRKAYSNCNDDDDNRHCPPQASTTRLVSVAVLHGNGLLVLNDILSNICHERGWDHWSRSRLGIR